MKELGYQQSNGNHILFFKYTSQGITILFVYVDDMIIKSDDKKGITSLTHQLAIDFEIKLFGELRYFLDIEVVFSRQIIYLSQHKYILNLLDDISMFGCKPAPTPIESEMKIGINDNTPIDRG